MQLFVWQMLWIPFWWILVKCSIACPPAVDLRWKIPNAWGPLNDLCCMIISISLWCNMKKHVNKGAEWWNILPRAKWVSQEPGIPCYVCLWKVQALVACPRYSADISENYSFYQPAFVSEAINEVMTHMSQLPSEIAVTVVAICSPPTGITKMVAIQCYKSPMNQSEVVV